MNRTILTAIIIVLLAVGGIFAYTQMQQNPQSSTNEVHVTNEGETMHVPTEAMTTPTGESSPEAKMQKENMIIVEAQNFSFTPKEIRVKNGEVVKILFKNMQGFHDFVIDEFDVKTKQLQAGQEEEITFTPNKTGEFEYYCSVGEHRQKGMVGKLIVE